MRLVNVEGSVRADNGGDEGPGAKSARLEPVGWAVIV